MIDREDANNMAKFLYAKAKNDFPWTGTSEYDNGIHSALMHASEALYDLANYYEHNNAETELQAVLRYLRRRHKALQGGMKQHRQGKAAGYALAISDVEKQINHLQKQAN